MADIDIWRRVVHAGPDLRGHGGIATLLGQYRAVLGQRLRFCAVNGAKPGPASKLRSLAAFGRLFLLRMRGGRILHVHYASGAGSWHRENLLASWGRVLGFKTVMHCHSNLHLVTGNYGEGAVARALGRASANIVLAKEYKAYADEVLGLDNVHVLSNFLYGLEINSASCTGAVCRTEVHRPVRFLFLGLLNEAKGFYDLLQALGDLQSRGIDFRLVAGGTGDMQRLKSLAARYGISDKVDFAGWITGADKAAAIAGADVVVLPSYSEGMPMTVIEALYAGCALVVSDAGAMPDMVVDGDNGLVVGRGDVSALAGALARMATDNAFLQACRRRSAVLAEKYTAGAVLPQLEAIYGTVLQC